MNDLVVVGGNLALAGSLNVSALGWLRRRLRALFLLRRLSGNLSLGTLPSGFSYHIDLSSTPGEVLLDVTGVRPCPATSTMTAS